MAGYANRTILLSFPDLSEEGDRVHVIIRNPKTMATAELNPGNIPLGADGRPDEKAAEQAGYTVLARMVKAWHVYDATDDGDDQQPLPLPATPELIAKLPVEIQNRMAAEWKAVANPEA